MFKLQNYKTFLLLLINFGHFGWANNKTANTAFFRSKQTSLADNNTLGVSLERSVQIFGIAASIGACYFFYKATQNGFLAKKFQKNVVAEQERLSFDSVAGAHAAKEGLKDIVDYLKDPNKCGRLGAKVPKGVLLEGAPGNGKTLLARAMAGEANCAFYSISGSEFNSMYLGEGPARVRRVFEEARKNAPAILFIDEIDSIGSSRDNGDGQKWYHETLNQLLTCMDGFNVFQKPLIVIAATNHANALDKALLRPGRFDRVIEVPLPDLQSRIEILKLHLQKFTVGSGVDPVKIARATPGFSGADLANLINEAALAATKHGKEVIEMADFNDARDKIIMGSVSNTIVLTEKDRQMTAFHEAGHALITLMLPEVLDPLHRVTITPRGKALGVTYSLPEREKYTSTKSELLARITMACGGRAAEELVFGDITTGAHDDFNKATNIARQMVCNYGMSEEVGLAVYAKNGHSPATAELIDKAVNEIVKRCYERAKDLLIANRDKLDQLANALLEKETLESSEIYELLGIEPRPGLEHVVV